jgi:hypothetical protein
LTEVFKMADQAMYLVKARKKRESGQPAAHLLAADNLPGKTG